MKLRELLCVLAAPGLAFVVLPAMLTASCANLPAVVSDIAAIVNVVITDIEAGKPFAQVLADTGSDDASLLIAIIQGIEGDPKLDAATKAAYVKACAPYLLEAQVRVAGEHR